jgi:hypothetical protein
MALFACKVGGSEGGLNVTGATLSLSDSHGTTNQWGNCTANISAGHVAVVSVWQRSGSGTLTTTVDISGTEGTDYEVIMNDTTSKVVAGQVIDLQKFVGMVIKAKNAITITAKHGGGQNYPGGGILLYDLS